MKFIFVRQNLSQFIYTRISIADLQGKLWNKYWQTWFYQMFSVTPRWAPKLIYNYHFSFKINWIFFLKKKKQTGQDVSAALTTTKVNKTQPVVNNNKPTALNNNKKKFDFLATETTPDYRPRSIIIEKEEKTTNNQKTQFQQLQQLFNNMTNNHETIENDIPLIKDISTIEENFNTVNEVCWRHFFFD